MYYFVPLVVIHRPVALLSQLCRLPVAFLSPSCRTKTPCRSRVALLSLSCCSPVAFSCRFPVTSLSPLALLPSCRLPVAFLSLILSLCLVSCRFPVVSLSPTCRCPVALLSPSCRTSPFGFLLPACRFLSPSCLFPAAGLSSSCRHPVVFLSPPCRLPVAPCRISLSPASRGPNLLSEMQFFAFGGAHFWVFPCQLCQQFQPCQRGGMNQPTSLLDKGDVFLLLHFLTSLLLGVDLACLLYLIVRS